MRSKQKFIIIYNRRKWHIIALIQGVGIMNRKLSFFFSLFVNLLQLTFPIYMLQVYDKVLTSFSMSTLGVITVAAVLALAVLAAVLIFHDKKPSPEISVKFDTAGGNEIEEQIAIFSKLKVALAPHFGRGADPAIIQASIDDAKANFLPKIDSLIGAVDW